MPTTLPFHRVAILGTGLIGGSFALALRKHYPGMALVGFDHSEAAEQRPEPRRNRQNRHRSAVCLARRRSGLHRDAHRRDDRSAPGHSGRRRAEPWSRDACSTKTVVVQDCGRAFPKRRAIPRRASHGGQRTFRHRIRRRGIISRRALRPDGQRGDKRENSDPRAKAFAQLLRKIGAQPVWMRSRDARLGGGHRVAPTAACFGCLGARGAG